MFAELKYAWRMLLKSPAFTAAAVVILALGIGANIAIFTVVRAVLLAPLPYPEADRIVAIFVVETLTQPQLYLALFGLFALLGLLLGGVGLYALIAFSVAQRSREFGIRFALGAQIRDVTKLVFAQGVKLTALGLTIGLLCAIASARLMTSLLFRTSAYDPTVFGGVVFLLAAVGLIAAVLPAWRAAKVDPIQALRTE